MFVGNTFTETRVTMIDNARDLLVFMGFSSHLPSG